MELIIKKAQKGGWNFIACEYEMVCDSRFWQSLGKACGWNDEENWNKNEKGYIQIALRFHEINLTEGWDKAVSYLESLITSN